MNNWFKIGVPVLIAVLLITATFAITLAVTARGSVGQAASPANVAGQEIGTQFARGSQCSSCTANTQGAAAGAPDASAGSVYVPKGATCPNCPGYVAATSEQPPTNSQGGCCRGR